MKQHDLDMDSDYDEDDLNLDELNIGCMSHTLPPNKRRHEIFTKLTVPTTEGKRRADLILSLIHI